MMAAQGTRLGGSRPWVLPLGLALALAAPATRARAEMCSPVSVGVDTSHINDCFPIYLSSAYGQVFEAKDTVLEAVSVWRGDPAGNIAPLRLYVLELDSTGTPDYQRILRVGPTLQIVYGDSVHPVQFRFVLDPPLVLPHPGHYEFAVQTAPPYCDWATCLFGDTRNPYPEGAAWEHRRFDPYLDCPLWSARLPNPDDDLIFRLEFCELPTPVRRSSWGELKVRYR